MCDPTEREKKAKLSRLSQETQKWFENVADDDFGNMNSQTRDFFDRARGEFAQGNDDLFSNFVHDNQSRFAELLESRRKNNFFNLHDDSFFSRNRLLDLNSLHRTDDERDAEIRKNSAGPFAFGSPSDPFSHPRFSSQLFGTSRMFSVPMNGFADSPSPLKSPVATFPKNGCMKTSYEMSSSKSMFEYRGSDSNTVRYSSEQMTRKFDYTSESEEDEDDDDDDDMDKEAIAYDARSETSDLSSVRDLNNATIPAIQQSDQTTVRVEKTQRIANELLNTERTYVGALKLVDQIFHFKVDNENRAHKMFPHEIITQMFSNIKSIYKLHSEHLMPQLEKRLDNWSNNARIGDIMRNFAPFLKMYTEYVKNFDNAMNLINCWYAKSPRFAAIMDDIHKMEECGHLTLQHHMLNPIQRVPRYKLLLTDYLKRLADDNPDKCDTQKALDLVSTAADHANDAMKRIDKFKKLLEIQEMIGGGVDLVSPTRELIKEGKIVKISARSGDHQERYIFLFSDMVLLCSLRLMSGRVVSGPCYRVRAKLAVEGMVVADGDNIETANSFYIRNSHKSIELYTQTAEDKVAWIEALCKVMCDFVKRKSSLQVTDQALLEMELGKRAPMLLRPDSISHCMACHTHFSAFAFKKKKHCKACGIIVCSKCSGQKVLLTYDLTKLNRVCDQCYAIVTKQLNIIETADGSAPQHGLSQSPDGYASPLLSPSLSKGVLEVKSCDPCIMSSHLLLKTRGKSWTKRWFSLHSDFVLYSFMTHEDDHAVTSTPIPGYVVGPAEKSDNTDNKSHVFKISHSKNRVYFFQASSQEEMGRWLASLIKASKAECFTPLPD